MNQVLQDTNLSFYSKSSIFTDLFRQLTGDNNHNIDFIDIACKLPKITERQIKKTHNVIIILFMKLIILQIFRHPLIPEVYPPYP
jgi:hypothetical protein